MESGFAGAEHFSEEAAGFGERSVVDEVGDGGAADGIGAGSGDETRDGMAPKGNDANGDAGGFAEGESCGGTEAERAEKFGDEAGVDASAGGVDDEADHQALECEKNGKVGERDGLHADHAAESAEGFEERGGDEGLGAAGVCESGESELRGGGERGAEDFGGGGIGDREGGGVARGEGGFGEEEVCQAALEAALRADAEHGGGGEGGALDGGFPAGGIVGRVLDDEDEIGGGLREGVLDVGSGNIVAGVEDLDIGAGGDGVGAPAVARFAGVEAGNSKRGEQRGNAGGAVADEHEARRARIEKEVADGLEFAQDGLLQAAGEFFQKPGELVVEPQERGWGGGAHRLFRTASMCAAGAILRWTAWIFPSGSMTKVLRSVPMYFLPYMLFSTHTP